MKLPPLEKLRDGDLQRFLERAEHLTNVLPPRPGGVLEALERAPEADVIVVAHVGLEGYSSVAQILSRLPMQHSVRMAWCHIPRADIPQGREERTDWLYEWWERVDTWVDSHAAPGLPSLPSDDDDPPGPRFDGPGG